MDEDDRSSKVKAWSAATTTTGVQQMADANDVLTDGARRRNYAGSIGAHDKLLSDTHTNILILPKDPGSCDLGLLSLALAMAFELSGLRMPSLTSSSSTGDNVCPWQHQDRLGLCGKQKGPELAFEWEHRRKAAAHEGYKLPQMVGKTAW